MTTTDHAFDLTCKCGPNHDACAIDCQCACHDDPELASIEEAQP